MIYLDNAATTKVCKSALDRMIEYGGEKYYNPSSTNHYSLNIAKEIIEVKNHISEVLNTEFNNNIIFTGSATEANNLAIRGTLNRFSTQLLFSLAEHPAVYNTAISLKEQGYNVKFINLQKSGEIDYEHLAELLKEPTSFISVMAVSNENGAINDLKRISKLRDKYAKEALFHSDLVQGFCKINLDVDDCGLDLATISAHKIYGPKGIGALWIKHKTKLKPIIFGGGQEYNIRSGTENVSAIMGFNEAIDFCKDIDFNYRYVDSLKKEFLSVFNGLAFTNNSIKGSPYILSLSFDGVRGETLQHMMEQDDIIISTGSACSSKKIGNRFLDAIGQKNIIGSIRVSFSKDSTKEDVVVAAQRLRDNYLKLYKTLKG